jgi:hypothetical protein
VRSRFTTIVVNDFINDQRTLHLLTDNEFAAIDMTWTKPDSILADMQGIDLFTDRLCWSDLDPIHYRLMIETNLEPYGKLPERQRTDIKNKITNSLRFLIGCLITCLQNRADIMIELIHINRDATNNVSYDFTAVLPPLPKKKAFRVVVDNT